MCTAYKPIEEDDENVEDDDENVDDEHHENDAKGANDVAEQGKVADELNAMGETRAKSDTHNDSTAENQLSQGMDIDSQPETVCINIIPQAIYSRESLVLQFLKTIKLANN
jgi:hypothetical protein